MMHAPQIIMIVLLAVRLVLNAANDGQPIKPPPHPNYSFGRAVFGVAIMSGLLWWGGFFEGVV